MRQLHHLLWVEELKLLWIHLRPYRWELEWRPAPKLGDQSRLTLGIPGGSYRPRCCRNGGTGEIISSGSGDNVSIQLLVDIDENSGILNKPSWLYENYR